MRYSFPNRSASVLLISLGMLLLIGAGGPAVFSAATTGRASAHDQQAASESARNPASNALQWVMAKNYRWPGPPGCALINGHIVT